MAATGSIVEGPLATAALANAVALPSARTAYQLMSQILGDNTAPLILASLPLSATAIGDGLLAYEASLVAGEVASQAAKLGA
ncbi:hypothetical protein [Roseateles sp.]|uniref:hypothetical protein n=1 Tax=Roseateles sp. TaxID=1971397 RepID=UPI0032631DDE